MPAVIELDVPAPAGPRPERGARGPSWLAVGLVGLAVLALIGGAQPARSFAPVFTADHTLAGSLAFGGNVPGVALTENAVYVARITQPIDVIVHAYRPLTGEELWSKAYGAGADLVYADEQSVVLFIEERAAPEPAVIGVDPATGAIRWRRTGLDGVVATRGVVLTETRLRPVTGEDTSRVARRVTALSTVDGSVRWSVDLPEGTLSGHQFDDLTNVVEVHPDGLIRERALDTGAVRREVRVSLPGPPMLTWMFGDVAVIGTGTVELGRPDATASVYQSKGDISAVDLDSGALLWRRADVWSAFVRCGAALCRVLAEQPAEAIDRRTGATLWRRDGLWLRGWLGDQLVLTRSFDDADAPLVIVDQATGRTLRELTGWQIAGWSTRGMLIRRLGRSGDVIARLDPRTGSRIVLGVEPRSLTAWNCQEARRYLLCAGRDRVSVWPLRSSWS